MPRPALAQKREFVAKAFCPRILVLATPALADACAVNHCSTLAELLAPFGQDVSTQITIQDGQGAPYFLDKLDVKFTTDYAIERQKQWTQAELDDMVRRSIADDEPEQAKMPLLPGGGVDADALAADDTGSWAPWYLRLRQHWVNEMQPSEHEAFMHPVACLLAASGSEDDPVGALRALQSHPAARRVQQQSFSGANVLLYNMLVHDGRDAGVLQAIDQTFDQVRRAFGQNTALLRINSNTELAEADGSDRSRISGIWTSSWATTQPLGARPEGTFGGMLTMRDVAALRDAVKQMMVRSVVPHMQYQIRVLSEQTAHERRGITGRLFSAGRRYFGASAKAAGAVAGVGGDVYFRYDSPEALMRKLADYSFMLKDFGFAQSVYQVARRDFQSEKAWKCYAGAQEMVGVCRLIADAHATRADIDAGFDEAAAMYLHKTNAPCLYLAVRCIIVYYELLRHSKLYALAPRALLQVPAGTGALHALMAEQAAYAHLRRGGRPELRRFAFYAMVAAQTYQAAGIGGLARRCLHMVRIALSPAADASGVERGLPSRSGWSSIDSYVNHELGQQCVAARSYGDALQYFTALLGSGQIPEKLQSTYLQELLQLYLEGHDSVAATGGTRSEPGVAVELLIPTIDPRMARVIMSPELEGEDGVCLWRLGPDAPSSQTGEAAARLSCSVGEDVAVLLMVVNPLTVGITLNSFTLDCEFVPADGADAAAPDVSTTDAVILEGGQTTMVSVTVTPRCAGRLDIHSARYLLCDILPACTPLVLPGRRLNDTSAQRAAPTYAPDTRLGFCVDPHFPRLEVALEDFPDTLVSGSMHRASVRIANRGSHPCRSIALWLSHPSFFDIRSPVRAGADADADAADAPDSDMYVYSASVPAIKEASVANDLRDCSMVVLVGQAGPGDGVPTPLACLDAGETLTVPVWVRGDRVGAHTLGLLVGASTADDGPPLSRTAACAMRSRRFDVDLVVTPSLRVNAFVRPSLQNPHTRILGIEVENMQPNVDIQLLQTTFASGFYEVTPLHAPTAGAHETRVGPRQTASLMYVAAPRQAVGTDPPEARPELFTIAALRQYIFSKDKPTARPGPVSLVYSSAVLGERGIDATHPSLQGYIAQSQAQRRRGTLRGAFPLIPEKHHPALFTLYETFGIDFALFWREVGGAGRAGHHSITGIDLGVPHDYIVEALNPPAEGVARAWLKDTERERDALVHSIAARAAADARSERPIDVAMRAVQVDRAGTGAALYEATVAITVSNHSWRYTYDATLDLISPADMGRLVPAGARLDYTGARSAWAWCGATRHVLTLAPHGSTVVHAKLACCAPGMIDIALWALAAKAQPLEPEQKAPPVHAPRSVEALLYPLQPCFIQMVSQ